MEDVATRVPIQQGERELNVLKQHAQEDIETVTFSFTQSTMNLESPIIRSLQIPFFMAISISIQMSMNCAILLNPCPGEYLIWRKWFCLKNNITSWGWNSFRT